MKNVFYVLMVFCLLINTAKGQEDSIKVYWLDPIEVKSTKQIWGMSHFPFERANVSEIIKKGNFDFIRKGNFFATDLYADGLKRSDIVVTIDGERYPNACPNRMDSPITRINSFEMSNVEITKSSSNLHSGIGGKISFNRQKPEEKLKITGGISTLFDHSENYDGAFSFNYFNQKVSLRFTKGNSYEDANGRDFTDLYGYKKNNDFSLFEISYQGRLNKFKYGVSYSTTKDILFPYLMMDERTNDLVSASISYENHKLYFNFTDHSMDNGLRNSMMNMTTDATNYTVGIVGNFYEIYFRNWDANNLINNSNMRIENNLIPDLNLFSASVNKKLNFDNITLSGKLGFISYRTNEVNDYKLLYPNAESDRKFVKFSLSGSVSQMISDDIFAGLLAEISSEPAAPENFFIYAKRPMGKPTWIGNPGLDQAIKNTIRTMLNYKDLNLELFAHHINNYNNLTRIDKGNSKFMTNENIDAFLSGFNFKYSVSFLELETSYTFAENLDNDKPLAEIIPLNINAKIDFPEFLEMRSFLRWNYNDAQTRIEKSLGEKVSKSWNSFDLGFEYKLNKLTFVLEIMNLTNELFSQHLSYLRNPFAAGAKVFEPGRTVKLSLFFN